MGALAALLPALLPKLLDLLEPLIPDPAAREKAVQSILGMLMDADKGQMAVNAEEAKSANLFVAGWRPAIGWTCAAALCFEFLISPLAQWGGFMVGHPIPKPPTLSEHLWELLTGMLGLGALRSLEKIKKAAR
ncbi:MAG TPA: 3TM-type holin [Alphaproteobacteria bacterium]|nr:3TM-type holin [Alphaproteobacteria bacterium]